MAALFALFAGLFIAIAIARIFDCFDNKQENRKAMNKYKNYS